MTSPSPDHPLRPASTDTATAGGLLGPADQPWAVWLSASGDILPRPSRDAALATAAARNNAYAQAADRQPCYAVVLQHGRPWRGEETAPGARVSTDTRKVHLQFAELLREQIFAGPLQPGDRLAAQRDLAATYGVGLKTVRQAQQVLMDEGLLTRTSGGVAVAATPPVPVQPLPGLDLVPTQPVTGPATPAAGSHRGTAAYRRLARRLEELIEDGAYPPGSAFPTAGALAQQHGYTIASAQEAVRSLKDRRVLVTGPRGATVVAHVRGANVSSTIPWGDTTDVISTPTYG
ncbi:GntR family transcriptional regulator [Streptomyces sp. NPDC015125]|uniref:GntR family transcriptional regulator n=1 Tax=Streptomyces sp. NPDC015125 TaxID=3364938 RepID=UPI0036FB317B